MMKTFLRSVSILVLAISFFCNAAHADDAEEMAKLMDEFYEGLAEVIENNMDDPDKCLSEVDSYYEENKDTVEKVQELTAKAMEQVGVMMEQSESTWSADADRDYIDAEELAKMAQKSGLTESGAPQMEETDRYTKALEAFMKKHPMHALRIATKAMMFMAPSKTLE